MAAAAALLGVSRDTVYSLIKDGWLPASRLRGVLRVNRQTVERLLPPVGPEPSACEQVLLALPELSRQELAEVSSAIARRWLSEAGGGVEPEGRVHRVS